MKIARLLLLLCLAWSPGLRAQEQRLSIDITELPDEPFEDAVARAKEAGAEVTSLSLLWDDLEDSTGGYNPAFDWPSLANAYYPSEGLALTLTFSVIDTVADRRRSDLRGKPWDDPEVTRAFSRHIEDVLSRMRSVEITAIAIGNEVDGYLSSDAEVLAFAQFLSAARATIARLRPGVPVGTKLTHAALTETPARWSGLLARSDAVLVSYYPIDGFSQVKPMQVIEEDLNALIETAGDLPLYLLEAGYPSAGCGGSPEGQLEFVKTLLSFGAQNPETVKLISLTWLSDISLPEVEAYSSYYKIDLPCFAQYLGSLGLRARNGTPKPALTWLENR